MRDRSAPPARQRATFAHERNPLRAKHQADAWNGAPEAWDEFAEGRNRPLYHHVVELVGHRRGSALLDVGCGTGLFASLAVRHGFRVTGLDIARGLIAVARRRVADADFVVGDLEELPFADGAFDVVTAINSTPYAADPRRAISEMARVTVQGAMSS